jgi:hypothetical protein
MTPVRPPRRCAPARPCDGRPHRHPRGSPRRAPRPRGEAIPQGRTGRSLEPCPGQPCRLRKAYAAGPAGAPQRAPARCHPLRRGAPHRCRASPGCGRHQGGCGDRRRKRRRKGRALLGPCVPRMQNTLPLPAPMRGSVALPLHEARAGEERGVRPVWQSRGRRTQRSERRRARCGAARCIQHTPSCNSHSGFLLKMG